MFRGANQITKPWKSSPRPIGISSSSHLREKLYLKFREKIRKIFLFLSQGIKKGKFCQFLKILSPSIYRNVIREDFRIFDLEISSSSRVSRASKRFRFNF